MGGYYRLPFPRLAKQAWTIDWQGLPVRVLSPEHTLMHLCLHHYDEGDNALPLVDLGLALFRLPINYLSRRGNRCRCQPPILVMLQGLAELLPGVISFDVI